MKYNYYIAEGPKALEIKEKVVAERKSYSEKLDAVFSHMPRPERQSVMITESFGRIYLYGVAYSDSHLLSEDEKREYGVKNSEEQNQPDHTIYVPNIRFKAGKELKAKMESATNGMKTTQQLIVDALGVYAEAWAPAFKGMRICKTGVWEPEGHGKLYVRIPINEEKPGPTIPDWFREPQGEEWKHCVEAS